jgi:hypothetical protein
MVVTGKALPRRTVLRGIGVTVAVPWLDAMVPAVCANQLLPAPAPRLAAVYLGNGMNMSRWTPASEGSLTLSPILEPLAPYRDHLVVLSGLDNREGGSNDNGGLHSRVQPAWLTGTHAKRTEGADVEAGVSMDQVAASFLGRDTQVPSLELALEGVELSRACEPSFACTYVSTLSWKNATTPMPTEVDPRAVFERLFGDRDGTGSRARERRRDRSILDGVSADMARLRSQLGPTDRATLTSYLDAIRDVERHIEKAEQQATRPAPAVDVASFTGIPISFAEHAALMFELMVLAFQADVTRVATCLMVRERSDRIFPESGVHEPIHPLSHHEDDPGKLQAQAHLNRYHVSVFATLLGKLRATQDGDRTLLDRTVVLFGSGMSDSNRHSPRAVPTLLAGGSDFGISGGRHVACPAATPLANLQATLLRKIGVGVPRFGDSTGELSL